MCALRTLFNSVRSLGSPHRGISIGVSGPLLVSINGYCKARVRTPTFTERVRRVIQGLTPESGECGRLSVENRGKHRRHDGQFAPLAGSADSAIFV